MNIYYDPEKFGLSIVATLEYTDEPYSFDTRVVWKDALGRMFTARDSGCSCPTPFEDYNSVESLEPFDFQVIEAEIKSEMADEWSHINSQDAGQFLDTLRSIMDY